MKKATATTFSARQSAPFLSPRDGGSDLGSEPPVATVVREVRAAGRDRSCEGLTERREQEFNGDLLAFILTCLAAAHPIRPDRRRVR